MSPLVGVVSEMLGSQIYQMLGSQIYPGLFLKAHSKKLVNPDVNLVTIHHLEWTQD